MVKNAIKRGSLGLITRVLLASAMSAGAFASASAGEADAKQLLKAMSDYVGSQQAISFNYDAGTSFITTSGSIAPGETRDFLFGSFTPQNGPVAPGVYSFSNAAFIIGVYPALHHSAGLLR